MSTSTYKTPFGIAEIKRLKCRDRVQLNILEHVNLKLIEIPCFTAGGTKNQVTSC